MSTQIISILVRSLLCILFQIDGKKEICIGIDLGTTYSCVGVWQHGRVEILANGMGQRTTPSYVAFNETEQLVGDLALYQAVMNSSNTVFDAKRLIGRKFTDVTVQADMNHWPFKVVEGPKNIPMIEVQYKNETKRFKAEEISAMILTEMKSIAEEYLGETVQNAVITVPAYFNDSQRQATINAGTIAGLNVLRILSEPTAAAVAYGLHEKMSKQTILVFDLGGGTFDVSVMNIDKGVFEVKATVGDTHLGGEDFDNRMVAYFVQQFKKKFQKDITGNVRAMCRLKTACERTKRALSLSSKVPMEIDALYDGIDFYEIVTIDCFEILCHDYFQKCMDICESALLESKIGRHSIDEIVLVGGSTRIPKVRSMLSAMFQGKKLHQSINPDEAVAYGATVQAAIMSKVDKSNELPRFILYDVIPLSLGINVAGGVMSQIIGRNTIIPITKSGAYCTSEHITSKVDVEFRIFEGERTMTENNNLLGEFCLSSIQPMLFGKPTFYVTFTVDTNGILHVSAIEKRTGNSKDISISYDAERLTKNDIERMVAEAERYKAEDTTKKDLAQAKRQAKINSEKIHRRIATNTLKALDAAKVQAFKFLEAAVAAGVNKFEKQKICVRAVTQKILHK